MTNEEKNRRDDQLRQQGRDDRVQGRLPQSGEHYWLTTHRTYMGAYEGKS